MKLSFNNVKSILCIVFALICYNVSAQKVPTTQQGSLWAPQGIKIDGKLTEWGNSLQAYNKTVKLWYTLANDDKYIYLAVKSDDIDYNPKILAGGISLSINTAGKKKDKDAYVITFPVISRAGGGGRGGRGRRGGGFGQQQDTPDTAAIVAQQQQTLATGKQISAIGFKEITDTLISIYNEYGIKAAATIDNKGNYSAEIAIPLAMLNIPADQKEIAYNIKVNGLQMVMKNVTIGGNGGGGRLSISGNGGGGGFGGGGGGGGFGGGFGNHDGPDADDITAATDFWAKYTIAVNTTK